eukprot:NODE_11_length_54881_cov_1.430718.p31 type:complete len:195 gc:universal NODE_11_length_54881_cov_1.430718:33564-32980(-)
MSFRSLSQKSIILRLSSLKLKKLPRVFAFNLAQLQTIAADVREIEKGFRDIENELPNHDPPSSPEDRFYIVMRSFIDLNLKHLKSLQKMESDMKASFDQTIEYFGEDPKLATPETFFGTFSQFFNLYAKAKRDNLKIPELKVEIMKTQQSAVLKHQESTIMDGPERKGVMDELFESMKTGDAFKNNKRRAPTQS